MNEEEQAQADYEFDVSTIPQAHIVEMEQRGNWIHGLTDQGTRFRQHIPQGKRLNKKEGRFVIETVEIA